MGGAREAYRSITPNTQYQRDFSGKRSPAAGSAPYDFLEGDYRYPNMGNVHKSGLSGAIDKIWKYLFGGSGGGKMSDENMRILQEDRAAEADARRRGAWVGSGTNF